MTPSDVWWRNVSSPSTLLLSTHPSWPNPQTLPLQQLLLRFHHSERSTIFTDNEGTSERTNLPRMVVHPTITDGKPQQTHLNAHQCLMSSLALASISLIAIQEVSLLGLSPVDELPSTQLVVLLLGGRDEEVGLGDKIGWSGLY